MIYIVCNIDFNFMIYCVVILILLFVNNCNFEFCVYIIVSILLEVD